MVSGMIVEVTSLALKSIHDVRKADGLNTQATKKNVKSFTRESEARFAREQSQEIMEKAVIKLINRKKAVLCTSMDSFLTLYERIVKINFTEGDGIKELEDFSPALIEETHLQVAVAGKISDKSVITKNFVIGFLSGGMIGAAAGFLVDDAQYKLDTARILAKQAEVVAIHEDTINLSCQAITERVKRMTDVLTKLNFFFDKSISNTNEIIDENGMDKNNYSREERKGLAICVNLAGTVKNVLDAPIVDEYGEITKKSMEVILNGEKNIEEIGNVL